MMKKRVAAMLLSRKTRVHLDRLCLLASLLMMLALFAGCAGVPNGEPVLSGHILIDGSTALYPLIKQAASEFQKVHPQVRITVVANGSLTGLDDVTGAKSDIGNSDVYANPATYPDPRLTDHIICLIPFRIVVNPDVPITSLTQQQIIDIFSTHALSNWQQLLGPYLPIVPVVRPISSGTRATFVEYVLGGRDENDKGALPQQDSSQAIHDAVAKYPGAIGYLAAPYVDQKVRALAIDGYQPTKDSIEAGHYTFWNYEHMYTIEDNNPIITSFLDFMLTKPIQDEAQRMGYISMQNMKLPGLQ
jgi:phosphate transport system substrate-binding protein